MHRSSLRHVQNPNLELDPTKANPRQRIEVNANKKTANACMHALIGKSLTQSDLFSSKTNVVVAYAF